MSEKGEAMKNEKSIMRKFLTQFATQIDVFVGFVSGFIVPIQGFLLFTIALVFTDMFTGIRAAKKKEEKITSRGFYRTVEKLTLYVSLILLAHGFDWVFLNGIMEYSPVTYAASFAIARTEMKSNAENIKAVTGTDAWPEILEKIKIFKK